ncbi:hypothetical protein Pelo_17547 [Pelomyxa schiedti]|nr:hypothetical protein Pelo_17547 [Pelomyxa schiedti]
MEFRLASKDNKNKLKLPALGPENINVHQWLIHCQKLMEGFSENQVLLALYHTLKGEPATDNNESTVVGATARTGNKSVTWATPDKLAVVCDAGNNGSEDWIREFSLREMDKKNIAFINIQEEARHVKGSTATAAFCNFNWTGALKHLPETEQHILFQILSKFAELFVDKLEGTHTSVKGLTKHTIDTTDARPITAWGQKLTETEHVYIKEEVDKYLQQGVIRPSFRVSPTVGSAHRPGRLARWSLTLIEHNPEIIHKPGKSLVVPHTLSHFPQKEVQPLLMVEADTSALARQQKLDRRIQVILQILQGQEDVTGVDSRWIREIWKTKGEFVVGDEGILYRWVYTNPRRPPCFCLVLPESRKEEVLNQCHDSMFYGGHLSFDKNLPQD